MRIEEFERDRPPPRSRNSPGDDAAGSSRTGRGLARLSVERPHLTELLLRSADRSVVVIRAPAGWGKSCLLDEWTPILQQHGAVARIIADESSTAAGVWSDLVSQLILSSQRIPSLTDLAAQLRSPRPPPIATVIAQVLHAAAASPHPVTLILDDVHLLAPPVVGALALPALVTGAPPGLRLILSGRAVAGLPLGTWRMGGHLIDVGVPELRLRTEEAAALVQAHNLTVNAASLDRLLSRTQGWIGGFHLLCMAARRPGHSVQAVLDRLPDTDDEIAEYLVEQVLDTLEPEIRDFITVSCRLGTITADLAAVLTGRSVADSDAQLRRVAAATGFVTITAADPVVVHCHPLLADTLTVVLRRSDPDRLRATSAAAARWFADRGEIITAVEHAITAADWDLATELYLRGFPRLGARGEADRLRRLLDRFPEPMVLANPELATSAANARTMAGAVNDAERFTAAALAHIDRAPAHRQQRIRLSAGMLRPARARIQGDYSTVVQLTDDLAARALTTTTWTAQEANILAAMWSNRGTALLWSGDTAPAEDCLRRGIAMADMSWAELPRLNALSHLPWLDLPFGRLVVAERAAQQALLCADSLGLRTAYQAAPAHLALAWIAVEHADFTAAATSLDEARTASMPFNEHSVGVLIAMVQAIIDLHHGRIADAAAALDSLERDPRTSPRGAAVDDYVQWVRAAVLAAHHDPPPPEPADPASPHAVAVHALITAQAHLAAGDALEALDRLRDPHLAELVRHHHQLRIRLDLWTAYAAHLCGAHPTAQRLLERALTAARQDGYRLPLLELGAALPFLELYLAAMPPELGELGARITTDLQTFSTPNAPRTGALPEPLTARETEILPLLSTRLTTGEIAEYFTVSAATIKTHLSAIYRKLDASGRRDAAQRAHQLGLI